VKNWRWPVLVALVGWLAVVCTLNDPGITCDEPFSVLYGIEFVSRLSQRGRNFFSHESIVETFSQGREHPPLGRWAIGGVHRLVSGSRAGSQPGIQDILNARFAPATALALMLLLLTRCVAARLGNVAGVASGIALLLMPRVFADAHFAALDTFVSLTYMLGILTAAWMMQSRWPPLAAPVAGLLLGAALLTKIHGLFLPPLVGLWGLAWFRFRSIFPLILWGTTGLAVFFVGWPWLWSDLQEIWARVVGDEVAGNPPLFSHLFAFLGSSVERATIFVSYPGGSGTHRDSDVPWHYPWVMFAVTVPVGIHLLAGCGVWQHLASRRDDRRGWLYLMAVLFPLVVFSIPRVPVYDGVRLFAMVFPFWAAFAGQGAGWLFEWIEKRCGSPAAFGAGAVFLASQAFGIVYYHPFQLSYYNLFTGGLRGAASQGFEVTYWGDAVTTDLLDRWSAAAPERACGLLVPTLYADQAELYQSSGMLKRRQKLAGSENSTCPYVVVFNRQAYLNSVRSLIDDPSQKPMLENAVDGVWVARVYQQPPSAAKEEREGNNGP
jgi:4-amino-4-deoxy-L-arabinose transferase-like glycosyltransferase